MADDKPTKHAHNFKDLAGMRFGRLTVIRFACREKRTTKWACRCDCGSERIVHSHSLMRGRTTSCGCYNREQSGSRFKKHGMKHTREFNIWVLAKQRCFNPKSTAYKNYGGRGITMSEEWRHDFVRFYGDMGPCPPGMTIERVDNDGNYESGNCVWTTREQQNRNTRMTVRITHDGETHTLAEWSVKTGINLRTLRSRRRLGLPLFAPVAGRFGR